jgi:acyl dehydratase
MAPLYFEDVEVGFRFETPSRTVTEADLVAFAGVSGDFNPLHTDARFAAESIYGERIAHGALVLSITTGLRQRVGLFDGTLMGLLEIRSWRFTAPVRIGDTVRVACEITELRETSKPDRGIMVQRIDVLGENDAAVAGGEFVMLLRRR